MTLVNSYEKQVTKLFKSRMDDDPYRTYYINVFLFKCKAKAKLTNKSSFDII